MSAAGAGATWPADVIHVNEDGWVLINRGREHGVMPGLRLLVVGQGIRELRDIFAGEGTGSGAPALRIRRTYEQLEVIHAEPRCSIAVAARVPPERRPTIYQGPKGELLVWAPLPPNFTWPRPGEEPDATTDEEGWQGDVVTADASDSQEGDQSQAESASEEAATDTPPEHGEQEDERWEHALPLNGVGVGDVVLPAIPVTGGVPVTGGDDVQTGDIAPISPPGSGPSNPFESGRSYDWMGTQKDS